jgi:hypothetical protein
MSTINLQTLPGMALEKDGLYKSEISDAYKKLAKLKEETSNAEYTLNQLRRLDGESRGLEAAHIDRDDLIDIIETLLSNNLPVSKAFTKHEVNKTKCAGWASRAIRYSVDQTELGSALDLLAQHTDLILMEKYQVLDVKDIVKSASYSAALTKLKKQLAITRTLQDKDKQLTDKESTITIRDSEIRVLKEELLRDKSEDWKTRAVTLQQEGVSVTNIAKRLGVGRSTASTYLNSPDVKS